MHLFIIIKNNFKCVYHKLVIFKKITHDKLPTCKLKNNNRQMNTQSNLTHYSFV